MQFFETGDGALDREGMAVGTHVDPQRSDRFTMFVFGNNMVNARSEDIDISHGVGDTLDGKVLVAGELLRLKMLCEVGIMTRVNKSNQN